jgi:hypothetical protein
VLDNNDNTNIDKCEQSGDHSLPGFVCQRVPPNPDYSRNFLKRMAQITRYFYFPNIDYSDKKHPQKLF